MILTKIQSRFDEIAEDMAKELDEVMRDGAEVVADLAKQLAPADTGELRDSIEVEAWTEPGYYTVQATARAAVTKGRNRGAYYGPYVEFGTNDTPMQPFLGPALLAHQEQIMAEVRKKLATL